LPSNELGASDFIDWYNADLPHTTLEGATPDEIYFARRPACGQPRFECRDRRRSFKGQPGVCLELVVEFVADRRHLPRVQLTRAA
jgi:hypothetical protein